MIKTNNGATEIKVASIEELFMDVKNVIGAFVKFGKSIQVPEETIEQTLVKMIVDGFNDGGEIIDMHREDKE